MKRVDRASLTPASMDYASLRIRRPLQARSRETLERIMEATEELLEAAPFERISIQQITQRAGVASGSFYTRFPEKSAVLRALFARYLQDTEALAEEAVVAYSEESSIAVRVDSVVSMMVRAFRSRRGVARAAQLHYLRNPEEASEEMRQRLGQMYQRLAMLIRGDGRGIAHPQVDWATRFAIQLVAAACRAKILFTDHPVPDDAAASDTQLAAELSRAVLGYLTLESHGAGNV